MCCSFSFYVYIWILTFLIAEFVICQARIEGGWNSSPNTQYHIQTDEGDERYFRYQTLTGQYRKEKRLQDGSVVGTYGWVDADGFLRLKDYVADDQGYRIVRSKKVFVGGKAPIDQAIHSSKYAPSSVYVPSQQTTVKPEYSAVTSTPAYSSYNPVQPETARPSYSSYDTVPSKPARPAYSSYDTVQSEPARPAYSSQYVPSQPKPVYSSYTPTQTEAPAYASYSPVTDNSISSTAAPYRGHEQDSYLIGKSESSYDEKPLEFPSSDPADHLSYDRSELQPVVAITPQVRYSVSTTPTPPTPVYVSSTPAPKPVTFRPYYNPNGVQAEYNSNKEAEYDGVALTHNGFRYFLPKHYHEEEGSSSHRAGSFGYIDPFGIRRVIYYNTSPEKGFVHRKNNRYVGFNSTPYDPRY